MLSIRFVNCVPKVVRVIVELCIANPSDYKLSTAPPKKNFEGRQERLINQATGGQQLELNNPLNRTFL